MKRPAAPRTGRTSSGPRDGSDLVLPEGEWQEPPARTTSPSPSSNPSTSESPQRSVARLAPRLTERQRAGRRRWLVRVAASLAVIASIAGVVWLVAFSSVLALRADEVQVRGGGTWVDSAQVGETVGTWAGTPLVRLDAGDVLSPVLAMPGVADAELERNWPHGATVTITPREPVARVSGEDEVSLVAADGTRIATVAEADVPAGLAELDLDVTGEESAATAAAVLEVLDGLPPALAERVASASAESPRSITLVLDDEARVVWGDGSEAELKASVLQTLLQVEAREYDVSAPLAPTTS